MSDLGIDADPPSTAGGDEAEVDTAKRRQILDGARRVFFERGFEAASMDAITRAAGVSKATIYAYFPSKERLIAALVSIEKREQAERFVELVAEDRPIPEALTVVGARTIIAMSRPEAVARLRLVVGIAPRIPEIGRAFYEDGPVFATNRLGDYLARLAAEGRMAVDDPYRAARQFLDLCLAETSRRIIFGLETEISEREARDHARIATDVFLRAYPLTDGPPDGAAAVPRT